MGQETPGLYLSGHATAGEIKLFDKVEMQIKPARLTCLLGPSGVGKSTILKLFAQLDSGLQFHGNYGADHGGLGGQVAHMAQDDMLLPWLSALENVVLGDRLRGERPDMALAVSMLDQVGLGNFSKRRPATLSGGQRQRVALARTLMERRPIILLDEPFSALDALTRSQMQDLAARLLAGKTVLLVTHDPAEAIRLADEILIMTSEGIESFAVPPIPTPRPIADEEVLRAQAALLTRLREAA